MSTTKPLRDATVQTVARICGVSAVTVSRAFRPDTSVNPKTRKKILKAAEEAGYRPRVRMGRPRRPSNVQRERVEVILGGKLQTTFYSAILTAIECELATRGRVCLIRSANGEFQSFMQLCEMLRAAPQSPTLLVGYLPTKQVHALLEARPQTLLVDHTGDPALALPCASVGFDNAEAARMMTRHLWETGRRRILLLNGFRGHYFTREFEQGYRDVLEHAGATVDPDLIFETDFSPEDAMAKLEAALEAGTAFDAVLTTDELAAAVLHRLRTRGIRVPEEVAVGGCDGLEYGAYLAPPLTTVALDHDRLGRLAVEHILHSESAPEPRLRVRLLPQLVVRESTGAAVSSNTQHQNGKA